MQSIPLQQTASQIVKVVLDGQNCQILLYQKSQGLFFDLNSNGIDIVTGILAQDANPLICRKYAGFEGNLLFIDTMGASDPVYFGLGTRFNLVYLTAAENDLI